MRGWLLAGGLLLAAVAACSGTAPLDELRFACRSSDECVAPYTCLAGECTPPAQADAGVDAGTCPGQRGTELCGDRLDNDCDGVADCADPDCVAQACAEQGRVCSGGVCVCGGNGSAPEQREASCGDGRDNDCDGLADCADADCTAQACAAQGQVCAGGRCLCAGNGGVPEPEEATCSDGQDNDCDGLTDCEDPACGAATCGSGGRVCVGGTCTCSGNGGGPEATEQSCADGRDNDCDGRIDCKDPHCGGLTCSPAGNVCSSGACVCQPDAGTAEPTESHCGDNRDDDCNGAVDCADSACSGQACGPFRQCVGTVCTCLTDGGVPELAEQACGDGLDGDCDGLTDCEDPDCAGTTCGANGRRCSASSCGCGGNGGVPEPTEATCSDGADNDCDGLTDCEDPDCAKERCAAASPASVCCDSACVDLSTSRTHCGGCGVTCKMGQACEPVQQDALLSGRCTCASSAHCPAAGAGGLAAPQTCVNGFCACDSSSQCATGQACTQSEGLASPGWCHY